MTPKITPEHEAWRKAQAHEFVREHRKYFGYPEHMKTYLAGMEAEYDMAWEMGRIQAFEEAISYTDNAYAGLMAAKERAESDLAKLLGEEKA